MTSTKTSNGSKQPPDMGCISLIDDMMQRHFSKRRNARTRFYDIDFDWTPEALRLIAEHPKKWMPIHKMVRYLETGSRFAFWNMVFLNRQLIPKSELLKVWYDCLNDDGCLNFQKITTPDGVQEFPAKISDISRLKDAVITEPLLIDNPIVCHRYCQAKKTGWQMLQYIHGRRHQPLRLGESIHDTILEDNLPAFAMLFTAEKRNISFSLLTDILEHRAKLIFRYLVSNSMLPETIITMEELCCYLTASFPDTVSVPFLTILEEMRPGLLKGVKDAFGRNLLWFTCQNMKTAWFHPDCQLIAFLLNHGCDAHNVNQLDLTWQDTRDGLTQERKRKMMYDRYECNRNTPHNPPMLELLQPMNRLMLNAHTGTRGDI